jgi:uncharacterized protein YciI
MQSELALLPCPFARRPACRLCVGQDAYVPPHLTWLAVSGDQYPRAMANFAVRLVHGPGWDASREIREQDGWDDHAAFMDALVDEGFIILGGPIEDGAETLHVVEAADEHDIRARLAEDPWAVAGLLRIGVVETWALWLDSRPVWRDRG